MTEYEDSDGPALTEEQRVYLRGIMDAISEVICACHQPIDAKALALLEITHDIIDQQLKIDIFHEWGPAMELDQAVTNKPEGQKFLFLDNEDSKKPASFDDDKDTAPPSAEDLKRWFGE